VERVARPRIGDVAERAGVSKTAVSFAFNRPERLNEGTMETQVLPTRLVVRGSTASAAHRASPIASAPPR
jgi:hypothetical protein